MKTKFTLVLLLLTTLTGMAQQDTETLQKLSIFHEYVKSKNFDAAYKPWMFVREKKPKFNIAIYTDGEKILRDKIKKTTGQDKATYINDLIQLWKERIENFPAKTAEGEYTAMGCQLMYNERELLNKTDAEIYDCFDTAYQSSPKHFTNPKSLYTYFSLMVNLFDAGKKTDNDLFNKYDDIAETIDVNIEKYSSDLNKLVAKEEGGTALTTKEGKYKAYYQSYLKSYNQISRAIDSKLGNRANCENLIPLYNKDFEANKGNVVWLQRAAAKMSEKDCTSDPLFFKLVNAYHKLSPSANSAFYLGILKDKDGDSRAAIDYYKQAIELETDNFKKAKLNNRIALKLKKKGSFGEARKFFRESLRLNPSNGRPHLSIASMYASSAKHCGDTNFNKRAVYWLAANEARKASRVDASLKSLTAKSVASYVGRAPTKAEIFNCDCSGKVIKIGCWIGTSVTVPKI